MKIVAALVIALLVGAASAQQDTPSPSSPPGPLNLTEILDKAGQYTTLIKLLKETQVGKQLDNQVNTSTEGLTVLAPTDNAFNNLKAGTLNALTMEKQVELLLFHVLPKYYTFDTLLTVPNPVRTQYSDGTLNFTSQSRQLNISSDLVQTQLHNALHQAFPLAVYELDSVLLPEALFQERAPPPASAPPPAAKGKDNDGGDKKADSPKPDGSHTSSLIAPLTPFLLAFLGLLASF